MVSRGDYVNKHVTWQDQGMMGPEEIGNTPTAFHTPPRLHIKAFAATRRTGSREPAHGHWSNHVTWSNPAKVAEVKIEVKNPKESHMSPLYQGRRSQRRPGAPEGSYLWMILQLPSSLELVINNNGWASSASQFSCLPGVYSGHVKPPGKGSCELD